MKASSTRSDNMDIGKVAPSAYEIEKAVLGIITMEKDAFDVVSDYLTPECFYRESHQIIYRAMQSMAQKNQHIDAISLAHALRSREELEAAGGPHALLVLQNGVTSSAGLEQHCRIILEKFLAREMIRVCGQIINTAYREDADVFSLLDNAEQTLFSIGNSTMRGEMTKIDAVLVKAMHRVDEWRKHESTINGIPSGFPKLDRITRGWQPGDLIILAARPSVGKTALALHLINSASTTIADNESVAVWSLEMDSVSLVLRLLAMKSEMLLHRIQTGRLDDDQMNMLYREGVSKLANQNIFFDDNAGLTLNSLRAKARRLKKKNKLRLIVVDYLQLMSIGEDTRNREQEISKISRGLKSLAKELQIPVIALSQLSREMEKRTGKKRQPQLSDLRESGAIEQDADLVMFLWGPEEDEIEADASLQNIRYARIAKHRNGMLGFVTLEFSNGIQRFKEIDDIPEKKQEKKQNGVDFKKALGSGNWRPVTTEDNELF